MTTQSKHNKIPADLNDLLYKELLNNPFMGVTLTDEKGTVIYVNQAHGRITEQPSHAYIGKTMQELTDNHTVSASATVRVLATNGEILLNQVVSNGKAFQVKGIPIRDADGKIKYVLNYLIDMSELAAIKEKIGEMRRYNETLSDKYELLRNTLQNNNTLIYQSKIMSRLVERAQKVGESDVTVLITGPSGCGKEHISNIIQKASRRNTMPFIKINCAAIPESLLESELFGYEPGAFTGGSPKGKKGLFECADHGTLLLDEIGDLPIMLQSKLLRVLEEREVRRIGGNTPTPVDFRLIASTNAPLKEMISQRKFREDLYYRLNVIEINIPDLDKRREDIPLLIEHFKIMFNAKYEKNKIIHPAAVNYLTTCDYPGNVRELRNIIERLVVQSLNDTITLDDTYDALGTLKMKSQSTEHILGHSIDIKNAKNASLKEMVSEYEKHLLTTYVKAYGNGTQVAKILNTDQSTISRKLSKHKINP